MQKFLRKADPIILVVIALGAGVVSALDYFDLLGSISLNYPALTLLLLSMIGLHLLVSHFSQEDFRVDTTALLQRVADGMSAFDLRIYTDSLEIESNLARRILEARRSVRDLSWKAKISEGFSASDRQLAHEYMEKAISEASERISYREIFIFNDSRRAERLERRLAEQKRAYSCRYFKEDTHIPRLQFVIVDDEEVFFFASAADSILCSFRNKDLSKVFRSYYEAAWNAAIPIKDGSRIDEKQVALIRKVQNIPRNPS
ncbi:MAG TPA: hypothetical protein VGK00_01755 [Anaerolineales bacterium]|jgi:hypothetical protein